MPWVICCDPILVAGVESPTEILGLIATSFGVSRSDCYLERGFLSVGCEFVPVAFLTSPYRWCGMRTTWIGSVGFRKWCEKHSEVHSPTLEIAGGDYLWFITVYGDAVDNSSGKRWRRGMYTGETPFMGVTDNWALSGCTPWTFIDVQQIIGAVQVSTWFTAELADGPTVEYTGFRISITTSSGFPGCCAQLAGTIEHKSLEATCTVIGRST